MGDHEASRRSPVRQRAARIRVLPARLAADSLLRNSAYIMTTSLVNALLGYVYWVTVARTYSARDIGVATALISAMILASVISDLGLGSALVALLARRGAGRDWSLTVSSALATGVASGVLAGAVLIVLLPLLSDALSVVDRSVGYAALLLAGVALWTLATLVDAVFVAERAAGKTLARNCAFAVLKIALVLISVLFFSTGPGGIFASWVVASGVTALAALVVLVPRLGRSFRPVSRGLWREARSMGRAMGGHHLINMGGLLPMYVLPLLVVGRLSAPENAFFYITWMLASPFFMVSPAVASALFAEGSHDAAQLWRKARAGALAIGLLLGGPMLVFLAGGGWMLGLFGPEYPSHGVVLLTLLVASAVPDAVTNIAVSMLRVNRRLGSAAALNIGMAIFVLVFSWLLLPRLGIAAVGWAWLIAQSLGSAAVLMPALAARRRRPGPLGSQRSVRPRAGTSDA